MAGFKPFKSEEITYTEKTILAGDSITVVIGDVIEADQSNFGVAKLAEAGTGSILGVVTGFSNAAGEVLSNGDQTSVATGSAHTTYIKYVPAFPWTMFYAPLSAVSGTTTGSDKSLVYFDLTDATKLNEASVSHPGTVAQFQSTGVDPNNSSQVVGFFVETFWANVNS